jgi:hypothetical protein
MSYAVNVNKNDLKCPYCGCKEFEHIRENEEYICRIDEMVIQLEVKCNECGKLYYGIFHEVVLDLYADTCFIHIHDDELFVKNSYNKTFVLDSIEKQ